MHAVTDILLPASRTRREHGVALVAAIAVIVIATLLTAAVAASLIGSNGRSVARAERVSVQSALDAGVNAYVRSLSLGTVSERTRYAMTRSAVESVVPDGSEVISGTDPSIPVKYRLASGTTPATGDGVHERVGTPVTSVQLYRFVNHPNSSISQNWAVRTPIDSDESVFWQLVRVDVPTSIVPGSKLSAYLRAWRGTNDGQTFSRERVIRVEVTAGYFSDYQMLVNSTVLFSGGATMNGPIHSNGTSNTPGVDTRIGFTTFSVSRGPGGVTCGTGASVTTGTGPINLPADCTQSANTGTFIDFGRVSNSFDRINADCSLSTTDGVHCFNAIQGTAGYRVRMTAGNVQVIGTTTTNISVATGDVVVILIKDDVDVSGSTPGRVTIAARHPANAMNRAANITISGNITSPDSTPRRDVIGLMAEGHVIVGLPVPDGANRTGTCMGEKTYPFAPPTPTSPQTADPGSTTRTIEAAIIAATGGLRIPTEWTTYANPGLPPYCRQVNIVGAIASHYAPVLEWQWPTGDRAGFERRDYTWDSTLRENPPPYFPLTRTWESLNVKEANLDCLRGGARVNDWNCR